jgi:hypothetical protein
MAQGKDAPESLDRGVKTSTGDQEESWKYLKGATPDLYGFGEPSPWDKKRGDD